MRSPLVGPRFVWFAVKAAMKAKRKKEGQYYRTYGVVGTFYGITVTRCLVHTPQSGFSNWMNNPTNRKHQIDAIYICFYEGSCIAVVARWLCGTWTPHFTMLDQGEHLMCKRCEDKFLLKPSAGDTLGVDCC